jgi:hypothetical protein
LLSSGTWEFNGYFCRGSDNVGRYMWTIALLADGCWLLPAGWLAAGWLLLGCWLAAGWLLAAGCLPACLLASGWILAAGCCLRCPAPFLGCFGLVLGVSWVSLGLIRVFLGLCEPVLDPPWAALRLYRALLGMSWACLWAILGVSWGFNAFWILCWSILEPALGLFSGIFLNPFRDSFLDQFLTTSGAISAFIFEYNWGKQLDLFFDRLSKALRESLGRLLGSLGALLGGLVAQNHCKNKYETHITKTYVFATLSVLEWFWGPSWLFLGIFGHQSGSRNFTNACPKSCSIFDQFLDYFLEQLDLPNLTNFFGLPKATQKIIKH